MRLSSNLSVCILVCGYTGVWVYWCVGILVCGVATRGREAPTRDAAKLLVYI